MRPPSGANTFSTASTPPTSQAAKSIAGVYQKSYALVIGIDDYDGRGWPKLSNAVADAAAVRDALQSQGFSVTYRTDLRSRELEDAVRDFFITVGADKDAALVFWFAGHGYSNNGEGYIVPADAPGPSDDAGFRRTAISMREFGKLMREVRSHHVLSIFDACFAGTVFKATRAGPERVSTYTMHPVRQFITSGQANQKVLDDGYFRTQFVRAIAGQDPMADYNKDGFVTGNELGLFLKHKMIERTSYRQTPDFGELAEEGFDKGDFVFRVGNSTGGPIMPLPAALPSAGEAPLRTSGAARVFVAPVTGAPGDGNIALWRALREQLRRQGYQVLDFDTDGAHKLHAVVAMRSAGLLVDEVSIRWQVFSRSGVQVASIETKDDVLVGMRSGQWGDAANRSADRAIRRLGQHLAVP